MAVEDIRLKASWRGHPKRVKLQRRLGSGAVVAVVDLWVYASQMKPDGNLTDMDTEDIAIAAGYDGDATEFVTALLDFGLLDRGESGELAIHDWQVHNPWAAGFADRSQYAQRAALVRWHFTHSKPRKGCPKCPQNGRRNRRKDLERKESMRMHADRNAESCTPQCSTSTSISNSTTISNSYSREEEEAGGALAKSANPEQVRDWWNELAGEMGLPTVRALTKGRRAKIRLRSAYLDTPEKRLEIGHSIASQDFLRGENDRGWRATLDWLVANDQNIPKVLERVYFKANAKSDLQAQAERLLGGNSGRVQPESDGTIHSAETALPPGHEQDNR